ncbi:hypothetical protein TPB0596_12620 [Tsukamurella pulmonis]|uniref:peptidoglycan DD-metalloendopeptidase family protein n=1 Tax=Tsukamurella pulmonis TaxID=47312 RepID=UPI001EE048BB|nr:peptidoglycan DD-metalloendopeptidase family protein [Tsukamurella pulmonis]BDD81499.1 hypothetical protein TPB0596_12620 [Tsukamurella pulmonis]
MTIRYWPLERGHEVTSPFGARWGTTHWGIDFGWPGGSGGRPVFAVKAGTVTAAGAASGFGQWVNVDHPAEVGGGLTVYGHVIPEVRVGQRVEAGQRIARINPDSNTNGGVAPHLHLEWHRFVWVPPGPDRLDPLPLLQGALYPGDTPPAAPAIDAQPLAAAMGCSLSRAEQMLPGYIVAMDAAEITNANRAAMFAAQIGHESAGLVYMEEIADGSQYEGRTDLGNTQPGDGRRFKGSGPIQLTGRRNFTLFSRWAYEHGHIASPTLLVERPEMVRSDPRLGFLAASWYWTVARPQINAMCDRGDLEGVTRAINGGLNGINDRRTRWNRCRVLGDRLLPGKDWLDMATKDEVRELIYECLQAFVGPIGSDVKDIRQQLTGGRDAGEYGGFDQTGQRTVTDTVAAIAQKVGVPRTRDTLPTAPKKEG